MDGLHATQVVRVAREFAVVRHVDLHAVGVLGHPAEVRVDEVRRIVHPKGLQEALDGEQAALHLEQVHSPMRTRRDGETVAVSLHGGGLTVFEGVVGLLGRHAQPAVLQDVEDHGSRGQPLEVPSGVLHVAFHGGIEEVPLGTPVRVLPGDHAFGEADEGVVLGERVDHLGVQVLVLLADPQDVGVPRQDPARDHQRGLAAQAQLGEQLTSQLRHLCGGVGHLNPKPRQGLQDREDLRVTGLGDGGHELHSAPRRPQPGALSPAGAALEIHREPPYETPDVVAAEPRIGRIGGPRIAGTRGPGGGFEEQLC